MPAFPAVPYSAVTFPDDECLIVPMRLAEGLCTAGTVLLWLLLVRLDERHPEVEVSMAQLERHTGWTRAEIGEHARALAADDWVKIGRGSVPVAYVYRLQRRPTVTQIREWAEDLREPRRNAPSVPVPLSPQTHSLTRRSGSGG
ncbi:hypothetical protein ABT352_04650 [Streptosporangium sp. NPDC000563]|uniref:hypothetical protein n=1 Tax=Streptosporangium sp. NPDC000563 TaxID=3154366 RepID=UPI003322CEE6